MIQSLYPLQEKYFQLVNTHYSQNIDPTTNLIAHSQKQQEPKLKHETHLPSEVRDNFIHTCFTHNPQTLPIQSTKLVQPHVGSTLNQTRMLIYNYLLYLNSISQKATQHPRND